MTAHSDGEIDIILSRIRHEVARSASVASVQVAGIETKTGAIEGESTSDYCTNSTVRASLNGWSRPLAPTQPTLDFKPLITSFRPNLVGHYRAKDLVSYDDREFIHVAYLAILRRPADARGMESYLRALRGGRRKASILGSLRYSDEGKRAAVTIKGLWWRRVLAEARLPTLNESLRILSKRKDKNST